MPRFCTKCGNALKDGDKFCRKCGAPVKTIDTVSPAGPVQRDHINASPAPFENPEGTVLLGNMSNAQYGGPAVKKAEIRLTLSELLEGCTKVVDFGTGKKFELSIPPGLTPEDVITVEHSELIDSVTGKPCRIELTVLMG